MDVHKPGPIHDWRDFAKEVGIIVLGVLIALGAEQVVENLHWQERTRLAEQALKADLSGFAVPARSTFVLEACENEQLERLEHALLASGPDWKPPFIIHSRNRQLVFVTPVITTGSETWRNTQADGTANHLPDKRQALYADAYANLEHLQSANNAAIVDVSELNSLSVSRPIDAQSKTGYLRLIYRVRNYVHVGAYYGSQLFDDAKSLGADIPAAKYDRLLASYQEVCKSIHAGTDDVTVS